MKSITTLGLKRIGLGSVLSLALALGPVSSAFATENSEARSAALPYEEVQSFSTLAGFHDFDALDQDTLIVWTNPFRPYLIELAFPSPDLRFAQVIGIRGVNDRVYSRFDSVLIRGFSYPIHSIYKLTREEARELQRRA
jgi:Family of unknown function (DUF6491)